MVPCLLAGLPNLLLTNQDPVPDPRGTHLFPQAITMSGEQYPFTQSGPTAHLCWSLSQEQTSVSLLRGQKERRQPPLFGGHQQRSITRGLGDPVPALSGPLIFE